MEKQVFPPMSERETKNAVLSRNAATEGMVLLENRNMTLPLPGGSKKIALFGSGAVRTVRGGTGSGDPFNGGLSGGAPADTNQSPRYHVNIMDSFINAGFDVVTEDHMKNYVAGYDNELTGSANDPMKTFIYPEDELDVATVTAFSELTDTAIYVLSRNSGEGADRSMTKKFVHQDREYEAGDYLLSGTEMNNLKHITSAFKKTILVLNIGGVIDMSFVSELKNLGAILLMGQAGQEGGNAVLDVLTGKVTPSGKLTDTWAKTYRDYPASDTFAHNDGNVDVEKYTEGIYVGYRWFDSFGKVPFYPFGYGLSYTSFSSKYSGHSCDRETVTIHVEVTNTGKMYSGKEVVQVYCSAPEVNIQKPFQELVGFKKTRLLSPGESEILDICFKISDLASFDEKKELYSLERGDYRIRFGNSSRSTNPAVILRLESDVTTKLVYHELPLSQPLDEINRLGTQYGIEDSNWDHVPVITIDPASIECMDCRSKYQDGCVTTYTTDVDFAPILPYEKTEYRAKRNVTLLDVYKGKATLEDLVAQMSIDELASLTCGTGWGVANEDAPIVGENSSTVSGAAGETTPDLWEKYGIPSIVLADGPGGVRVNQEFEATNSVTNQKVKRYQYCTSWPVGTLLAQSFDLLLIEKVGEGISEELNELGITNILGPGLNIHRDPLCGRNFEYFSEDPLITGLMAAAFVRGVQSKPGVGACLKHYAANNQESNRHGVDTIVGERALREIYLRNFEIAVKDAKPMAIMTSYNLINGIPTADSFDLCTNFARGEWGFDGLIMTDWNGGKSTPSISMHAGNDLIMPGGPMRIKNISLAVQLLPPTFGTNGQITFYEEKAFFDIRKPDWNSFTPSEHGKDVAEAKLGTEYTAEVKDEKILVNGEPIYMDFNMVPPPHFRRPGMNYGFTHQVTVKDASVSADGKTIYYKGTMTLTPSITKGDIQRCVMNNLKVIMYSISMKKAYPNIDLKVYAECVAKD